MPLRRLSLLATIAAAFFVFSGSLAAEAPQLGGKVYRVGTLSMGTLDPSQPDWWGPFRDAMRNLGYVEGRNFVLTRAAASGQPERLAGLVNGLVRDNMDVIVVVGPREAQAAKQATSTIPIVMILVTDPVGQGLVTSLARPGGNVTGLTTFVPGLKQKYVELLRELVPSASRFGVIASPSNLVPESLREVEGAAKILGLTLISLPVRTPYEFEGALVRARGEGAAGIIAIPDPLTLQHRSALARLVVTHRFPAIYWTRDYVEVGGLMAYSADLVHLRQRAAVYVDKILKGAKPADLPVEQPTRFELVVNPKTAKAIGVTIPPSLLARADEVIE